MRFFYVVSLSLFGSGERRRQRAATISPSGAHSQQRAAIDTVAVVAIGLRQVNRLGT